MVGLPQTGVNFFASFKGPICFGINAAQNCKRLYANWLILITYPKFGRRPKENVSVGTDNGTAALHYLGGRVKGGLYGRQPNLPYTRELIFYI